MTNAHAVVGLGYAIRAFQRILGVEGHRFGVTGRLEHGISDDVQGVQWNVKVDQDTEEARLGVNLEGMKYDGWPIASFIENELARSRLLEVAPRVEGNTEIWVAFYRDAWQASVRALINERTISQTKLSELSETEWKRTLEEAYTCLDPARNHRGRATQMVTFSDRGERLMDVSPHLHIYTIVWETTPNSENIAQARIERGIELLKPIHEIVTNQSR